MFELLGDISPRTLARERIAGSGGLLTGAGARKLGRMRWHDVIARGAARFEVAGQAAQLVGYVERFDRWNQRINLSAARGPDVVAEHVVDCLALLPHVPVGATVIDVGSGGGLPGLVLAAARPDLTITCVEPLHKKAAFLRQATRELTLKVTVLTQRVEEVSGTFGVAVSRATFDLRTWLERGRALAPGGVVLGMEGLDQVELPTGATRHPYDAGDRTRAIIVMRVV